MVFASHGELLATAGELMPDIPRDTSTVCSTTGWRGWNGFLNITVIIIYTINIG
jgi:hypothetical protein